MASEQELENASLRGGAIGDGDKVAQPMVNKRCGHRCTRSNNG